MSPSAHCRLFKFLPTHTDSPNLHFSPNRFHYAITTQRVSISSGLARFWDQSPRKTQRIIRNLSILSRTVKGRFFHRNQTPGNAFVTPPSKHLNDYVSPAAFRFDWGHNRAMYRWNSRYIEITFCGFYEYDPKASTSTIDEMVGCSRDTSRILP